MLKVTLFAWIAVGLLEALRVCAPLGFLTGLGAFAFDRERDDWLRPWLIYVALLGLLPGGAYLTAGWLSEHIFTRPIWAGQFHFGIWIASAVAGIVAAIVGKRYGSQWLDRVFEKFTVRTSLERNKKTDVREIHKFLPKEIGAFDPTAYFGKRADAIFVGLNEEKKPVFIKYEEWKISHCLLTGRTRSFKGVAAQTLLSQALARGEYVVILDPKCDNWMPHVFQQACQKAGLPYRFIDLRQSAGPQTNLFAGCDEETLENMLIGGFSLTEKGEAADFYRLADRKAARECARWLAGHPGATARDALIALGDAWEESAKAFHSYMQEMAELPPVCRSEPGGIDVAAGAQTGGCLYVMGDMINPRIIRMQRMILLRLLFLAKNRDQLAQNHRTICVFADEYKVHISKPFMTSLGASAGWNLHTILAFQSLQDLADCPADLDKDAVRGAVMENCAIQLSYAIKDPETARWLAESTGEILVDDESRKVTKNVTLSERMEGDRTLRQAERNLIDTNMLMNLPKGCGVLSVVGRLADFCYTSPVVVKRSAAAITPTAPPENVAAVPPTVGAASLDLGDAK